MNLTQREIDFIKEKGICVVGTKSEYNVVNLSPRFLIEVNEDSIIFVSIFPNKTLFNLRKNNKVCISTWDNALDGARFLKIYGIVENYSSGPVYDRILNMLKGTGINVKPLAVTLVKILKYFYMEV